MFKKEQESNEATWMSISDLMSVLMMIFLFIAVAYMIEVSAERNKVTQIAVTYNKLQNDLYDDIKREFKDSLVSWNAEIVKGSVIFLSPDVLFNVGSDVVNKRFQDILANFFPRYLRILAHEKYRNDIEEIRIEGHTSSEWSYDADEMQAYFLNMELSQARTRAVLKFVLNLPSVYASKKRPWVQEHLTANGLSSSKPLMEEGRENKKKSRRVEFKVRTNAESKLVQILENN